MKKVAFLTVFIVVSSFAFAQKIELQAKVDERCELLSTVFRLTGAEEYVTHEISFYVDSLDKYFEPYKTHEILEYTKMYRENFGVGYDAPMSLAVHLQIIDGKISLISNVKETSLESRWDRDYLPRFIELLNDFYTTTKFHDFFVSQSDFVEKVEQTETEYFQKVDMEWYQKFFGEVPEGNFNLIISLSNGNNNYGPKVEYLDGKEELYSITICAIDSLNNPYFSDRWALNLIIHEFCHSFCNPLIFDNYDKMKKKADEFYKIKEDLLNRQAYGNSQTMLYEILVRACVIKYMADHYPTNPEKYFSNEKSNGFIWIEELYNSLLQYEKERDKYPTLKSYMPEIVKVQNKLNPKKMLKEQEKLMPVMSIANIKNNAQDVDATTTQIIVQFSRKMNTKANGSTYGTKGKDYFPKVIGAKWNEETKTEWILEVKLEQDKEYSIAFPAQWFFSEDGVNAKNTVYLDFKTK
jgi:predicted transposase YbfD/YdcC